MGKKMALIIGQRERLEGKKKLRMRERHLG